MEDQEGLLLGLFVCFIGGSLPGIPGVIDPWGEHAHVDECQANDGAAWQEGFVGKHEKHGDDGPDHCFKGKIAREKLPQEFCGMFFIKACKNGGRHHAHEKYHHTQLRTGWVDNVQHHHYPLFVGVRHKSNRLVFAASEHGIGHDAMAQKHRGKQAPKAVQQANAQHAACFDQIDKNGQEKDIGKGKTI